MNETRVADLKFYQISFTGMNPRKTIDEKSIEELAKSISEVGMLQPIVVRTTDLEGAYELVCGERRLRAAEKCKLPTIPAVIRTLSNNEAMDLMITENLQRKDVHPLEEAEAFQQLIDNMSHDIASLVKRFGKNEKYIRYRLKLNDLVDEFKQLLREDVIGFGHAFEICKLSENNQKEYFDDEFKERSDYWNCPTISNVKSNIEKSFSTKLAEAIFNPEAKALYTKAGACSSCPKNTASNMILFPEADEKGVCMDRVCFKTKTTLHMDKEIKRLSKKESDVLIMYPSYIWSDADKSRVKELQKNGVELKSDDGYWIVQEPELPEVVDSKEFNMKDPEEKKDYGDAMHDYDEDMADYKEELKEYQEEIKSPDLIKGFIVVGHDKGKLQYYKKNPHYNASSSSSHSVDDNTPEGQIEKLKAKDKRNKELQIEKTFDKMKVLVVEEKYSSGTADLSETEIKALMTLMLSRLDDDVALIISGKKDTYYMDSAKRKTHAEKLTKPQRNMILRNWIRKELDVGPGNYNSGEMDSLIAIAKECYPDKANEIELEQEGIYLKRKANIDKKIKALKKED